MLQLSVVFLFLPLLVALVLYKFRWYLTLVAGVILSGGTIYSLINFRGIQTGTDAPMYEVLYWLYIPGFTLACIVFRFLLSKLPFKTKNEKAT